MGTLILPVCGDSTRFPGTRPKFLLTHPNGKIMVRAGIDGLNLINTERIILTVRQDHLNKYNCEELIKKQFKGLPFELCILDQPTQGQADTVFNTLVKNHVTGPFQIKDCDNYFECNILNTNFVATSDLQQHPYINPSNKSYVQLHAHSGHLIDKIYEKKIISNLFCCGLYGFMSPQEYTKALVTLSPTSYISDVINKSLDIFETILATNYLDWGTYEDWNNYRDKFETLFVDIDGVLIENSDEIGWGHKPAIQKNVEFLQQKKNNGKTYIVLTTCRKIECAEITEKQLEKYQIPYDVILYDLPHCRRTIINDYSKTNKYPSCQAVNIPRNMDILSELIN
jgi:hypothetical protein